MEPSTTRPRKGIDGLTRTARQCGISGAYRDRRLGYHEAKTNEDMSECLILGGAVRTGSGSESLETNVAVILLCNINLYEAQSGIQVSVVDPRASLAGIDNNQ